MKVYIIDLVTPVTVSKSCSRLKKIIAFGEIEEIKIENWIFIDMAHRLRREYFTSVALFDSYDMHCEPQTREKGSME